MAIVDTSTGSPVATNPLTGEQVIAQQNAPQQQQQQQPAGPAVNQWAQYSYNPQQSKLREQMAQDLAKAQTTLSTTQKSLGLGNNIPQSFQERGIKIGNRLVAQDDLDTLFKVQKQAVQDYTRAAGFTSEIDSQIAQQHLNDKFNKIRLELLRRGQEFNMKLNQMNVSRAEKMAIAKNLGSLAGAAVGTYFGGAAGGAVGAQTGGGVGGGLASLGGANSPVDSNGIDTAEY